MKQEFPSVITATPGGLSILKNTEHFVELYLNQRELVSAHTDERIRRDKLFDLDVTYKHILEGVLKENALNPNFTEALFAHFENHPREDIRMIIPTWLRELFSGSQGHDIPARLLH